MRFNMHMSAMLLLALTIELCHSTPVRAGVTNPNISVIGNILLRMVDNPADPNHSRPQLAFEEAEVQFDDYLNPYARGTFVLAFSEEGAEIEEAFFEIVRGLPAGLGMKAGKFRQEFGRINSQHPHAYSFISTPALLEAYLPGEESFNDVGITFSELVPLGPVAATFSGTVVSGAAFLAEEDSSAESRPGWNFHWRNFVMVGARSSFQVGLSAASGISQPQYGMKTSLFGFDFKSKLYTAPTSYLTLQGEWISLSKDFDDGSGTGAIETFEPSGFYVSTDYTVGRIYGGVKIENFAEGEAGTPTISTMGLYGGFALLEESTLFRLLIENIKPDGVDSYNRYLLQAVFSMGPHRPHQF